MTPVGAGEPGGNALAASSANRARPEGPWLPPLGPFASLDQRWLIQTTDPELATFLEEAFAALRVDDSHERVTVFRVRLPTEGRAGGVYQDDEEVRASATEGHLLEDLIWSVTRLVAASAADRLLLHAAAVDLDGAAVVLAGPMNSGKSTLVAGLLDRGLGYMSDEIVAVAPTMTVHGYAKPLSIGRGSWRVLQHHAPGGSTHLRRYFSRQWQLPPQGFSRVVRSSSMAFVVFPRFRPGVTTRLQPVSPGSGLRMVVPMTFTTDRERLERRKLHSLADLLARVPAYELQFSDLDEACDAVVALLRSKNVCRPDLDEPWQAETLRGGPWPSAGGV